MFKKYKMRSYNYRLVVIIAVTCAYALAVVNSANSEYTEHRNDRCIFNDDIYIIC